MLFGNAWNTCGNIKNRAQKGVSTYLWGLDLLPEISPQVRSLALLTIY